MQGTGFSPLCCDPKAPTVRARVDRALASPRMGGEGPGSPQHGLSMGHGPEATP